MIEGFNFAVLIVSVLFCTIYYIKSVQPAALEKKIGKISYKKYTKYRIISIETQLAECKYGYYEKSIDLYKYSRDNSHLKIHELRAVRLNKHSLI